jgi:hypothetical protein
VGETGLVAKLGAKAFAFSGPDSGTVGVTCGRYGWNAVDWTGPVPDDEVLELVDASYDAIVAALPKARRPVG